MFFRSIYSLVVPLLISLSVSATEIKLNPDHPDQYVVVKGDTLWDISGNFLQNPWQWPDIWEKNSQIDNPNLIYPGDIIVFSYVDGNPRLSLAKSRRGKNGYEKLSPQIRTSDSKEAIKVISIDMIQQFLISPKVVSEYELKNAPYVVDIAGEHLIAGTGDRIYVRSIKDPQSSSFTVYRPGQAYQSPGNKEILGYEAVFIAESTLSSPGDPATLVINKADQEIRKGDRLLSNPEGQIDLNFYPKVPENAIDGSIISVFEGVSQIGQYHVVVIDKGLADGVKSGHVLEIYRRGKIISDSISQLKNQTVKLPDEQAGVLMVFRPFDRVSYALVMEATSAIHILDKVHTP